RFLGVELFGRAVDYETATDAIVRVRANDVRRRLTQYYSGHRSNVSVKIDLVAGGYVPEFHWATEDKADSSSKLENANSPTQTPAESTPQDPLAVPETEAAHIHLEKASRRSNAFWWRCTTAAMIAGALLAYILWPRPGNFDRFWQPVLAMSSAPVLNLP